MIEKELHDCWVTFGDVSFKAPKVVIRMHPAHVRDGRILTIRAPTPADAWRRLVDPTE